MLSPLDWKFLSEGNANIVVEYIANKEKFKGKVLRLRKGNNRDKQFVSLEQHWKFQQSLISSIFGADYVPGGVVYPISKDFLIGLQDLLENDRELERRQKGLDLDAQQGLLMDNLVLTTSHVFEIKPKWGFTPYSSMQKCRFCLHNQLKVGKNPLQASKYCPLKLYSPHIHEIHDAIDSLIQTPGNNFRAFRNGKKIDNLEQIDEMVIRVLGMAIHKKSILSNLKLHQEKFHGPIYMIHGMYTKMANLSPGIDSIVIEQVQELIGGTFDGHENTRKVAVYLLSMTLKDLSIMYSIEPVDSIEPVKTDFISLNTFSNDAPSNSFTLYINGVNFNVKTKIIDADPKSCTKLDDMLQLEHDLDNILRLNLCQVVP